MHTPIVLTVGSPEIDKIVSTLSNLPFRNAYLHLFCCILMKRPFSEARDCTESEFANALKLARWEICDNAQPQKGTVSIALDQRGN